MLNVTVQQFSCPPACSIVHIVGRKRCECSFVQQHDIDTKPNTPISYLNNNICTNNNNKPVIKQ